MTLSDFDSLTPDEFYSIWAAHAKKEDRHIRVSWEQARLLMLYSIIPHSKQRLQPKDIIKFAWEEKAITENEKPTRERFQLLSKLLNNECL